MVNAARSAVKRKGTVINMSSIEENLTGIPYWDKLTAEEQEKMKRSATIRKCAKGEMLSGSDTTCLGMTYVISGELRAYVLSEEGREITLFRLSKGETCVLSAACVISQITFDSHIAAEKKSEILVIPSCVFSSIVENNIYARCFMYEKMTERFSAVMFSMQQILFMRFDSRLASFLVAECDRTGSDEIRMTHEAIAQHVNSAREVVARMLKRFASDGLVTMKRGSVKIRDMAKLRELV